MRRARMLGYGFFIRWDVARQSEEGSGVEWRPSATGTTDAGRRYGTQCCADEKRYFRV